MNVHRNAHIFALHYNPFSITNAVTFTMAPKKRPRIVSLKINVNKCWGKVSILIFFCSMFLLGYNTLKETFAVYHRLKISQSKTILS